jgi:O-methyltransferase
LKSDLAQIEDDGPPVIGSNAPALYLDLLKKILTRTALPEQLALLEPPADSRTERFLRLARRLMKEPQLQFAKRIPYDPEKRLVGKDWPSEAETMIGTHRLDNLHQCAEDVLARNVPGDFIETGVWRGGATIFMRGVLKAYGITNRNVWVADSFEGLPRPDADKYPADKGDKHWTHPELAVGVDMVRANFARFGLLDEQVKFLVGWFRDTLPTAPIDKLALIRLDGDLYESTMDGLTNLYPKLSPGGIIIIDDYGCVKACKAAVTDYRAEQGITDEIKEIDWTGVYWRKG